MAAEINYDYFAFTQRLAGRHSIGFSAGILHMEPMIETTEYLPHGTGTVSYTHLTLPTKA